MNQSLIEMKNIFTSLFLVLCTITLNAQTKTWIGPDGLWADETKWLPEGVPDNSSDVIIPTGTTLDINANAQANSITVNAGATMDISANLLLFDNSIFAAGSIVDLVTGLISFSGGATLTVTGMLNVTSEFEKGLYGGGTLDVTAPGSINFDSSGGPFSLGNSADLKISPTGVMNIDGDLNFVSGGFSSASAIINQGTINKSSGTSTTNVLVSYEELNGVTNIESGTLNFGGFCMINGATYNVSEFCELLWSGAAKIFEGELAGVLDGPFTMDAELRIMEDLTASFNFTGTSQIDWIDVTRNFAGILYNYSIININGPSTINGTTVINHGVINLNSENGLGLMNLNAVLDNRVDGTININVETNIGSVFGPTNIYNSGVIKSQMGESLCQINPNVTNSSTGVIDTGSDLIYINGLYNGPGEIRGDGTFALTNGSSVLAGHVYPGENIGSITHASTTNLTTSAETVFHMEIDGTTPETEHDVFHIQDGVNLNGTFEIVLGFTPELNDEFVIMTFSDTLSNNLPETVELIYDGNTMVFDVIVSNTDVTLKVIDIVLGLEDLVGIFPNLRIGPNPSIGAINLNFGEYVEKGVIKIYDINGRLILNTLVEGVDRMNLDFEGSAGNYLMRFESNGKQASYLLVRY